MAVKCCQVLFLHLLRWSCDFGSFIVLMWCVTRVDLHMLSHPFMLGINPTCRALPTLLLCRWIWFERVLLEMFASIFITSSFLSAHCPGLALASGQCWPQTWVWERSLLLTFLEECKKDLCSFLFKYLVEFTDRTIWFLGFSVLGCFWLPIQSPYTLLLICSHFLFLPE